MTKIFKKIAIIFAVMLLVLSAACITVFTQPNKSRAVDDNFQGYNFIKTVSGKGHVLGLTLKGVLYGWGNNDRNQISSSTTKYFSEPIKISGIAGEVIDIAATENASAAVLLTGNVMVWGSSDKYQCGSTTDVKSPTTISIGDKALAVTVPPGMSDSMRGKLNLISAGAAHFAVAASNILVTWGDDTYGQCSGVKPAQETWVLPKEVDQVGGSGAVAAHRAYAAGNTTYIAVRNADIDRISARGESTMVTADFGTYFALSVQIEDLYPMKDHFLYTVNGTMVADEQTKNLKKYSMVNGIATDTTVCDMITACAVTGEDTVSFITSANNTKINKKLIVYGANNYGLGSNNALADFNSNAAPAEIEKSTVKLQGGTDAVLISSGYNCFFVTDSNNRLHIFGDSSTEEYKKKFPKSIDSEYISEGLASGINYSYAFNFIGGAENVGVTGTTRVISAYREGSSASDPDKPTINVQKYSFGFNMADGNIIFSQEKAENGMSGTIRDGFTIPQSSSVTTRFGVVNTELPTIISTTDASVSADKLQDILTLDYSTSGGRKIEVYGNMKLSRGATVTLRVPIIEYISTAPTSLMCDDMVALYYVNLTFEYDNWKPIAVSSGSNVEFKADSNARKNIEGKPDIMYADKQDNYSYRGREFAASQLVTDFDNNSISLGGVNNKPNSLKIKDIASLTYSSGINSENISAKLSEDRTSIILTALKAFSGRGQYIEVVVTDDYGAEVAVKIVVECVAKTSDVLKTEIFATGVQAAKVNTIKISDLFLDAGDLVFVPESILYNRNIITNYDINEENTEMSFDSSAAGDTRVLGSVRSLSNPSDTVNFEVKMTFGANQAPTQKSNRTIVINSSQQVEYDVTNLFTDPEGSKMTIEIVSEGTLGVVKLSTSRDKDKLYVKPTGKIGDDNVLIAVTDGVSGVIPYTFKFSVNNVYITSEKKMSMTDDTLYASELANYVQGYSDEAIKGALFVDDFADKVNETVAFELSADRSYITIKPQKKGVYNLSAKLQIADRSDIMVEVPISVATFYNKKAYLTFDVKENGSTKMNVSIDQIIKGLKLLDNSGNELAAKNYVYSAVHFKGNEDYAVATVSEDYLTVTALMNTPEFTYTEGMDVIEVGDPSGNGFAQLMYVDLKVKTTGEVYSIVVPVVVNGLKLYPTDGEYRIILIAAACGALAVVIIVILINYRINAVKRSKYQKEIEKAKVKDRLRKAQAMGANRQQSMSVALGKSKLTANEMRPNMQQPVRPNNMGQPRMPNVGMMPNPGMSPSMSMVNNMNASMTNAQMPPMGGQPNMGGQMPPMGGQPPNMGGQMPPMGGQPNMGGQMPQMGGQPNMGGQMPPMGGQPNMGGQMPQGMADNLSGGVNVHNGQDAQVMNFGDEEMPDEQPQQSMSYMPNFSSEDQRLQAPRNSSEAFVLEGEGGQQPIMTEMPPLKAQQNVPRDAREEIEEKIQARLKAEQSVNSNEQMSIQPFEAEPKLSKEEKKRQKMMEKLREKMNKDR